MTTTCELLPSKMRSNLCLLPSDFWLMPSNFPPPLTPAPYRNLQALQSEYDTLSEALLEEDGTHLRLKNALDEVDSRERGHIELILSLQRDLDDMVRENSRLLRSKEAELRAVESKHRVLSFESGGFLPLS